MRFKFIIPLLFLMTLLSSNASARSNINKVIYIDPIFDEDHIGVAPSNKSKAEVISRTIATAIRKQLEKRKYIVNMPEEADALLSFEDRLSISEKKKSSLYVVVSLSMSQSNCITFYYPTFEKKVYRKPADAEKYISDEFYDSLGNLFKKDISEDSGKLATILVNKVKKYSIEGCVASRASNSYILMIASYPMIIIDYALINIDKLPAYLTSDEPMNKMSNAIAEAIDEYYGAKEKAK